MRRLPAHHQNSIARVFDIVRQMVQDAPCFHHAAGTDDNSGLLEVVQVFRFGRGAGVVHRIRAEGVMPLQEQIGHFGIKRLGVYAINFGGVDGEGAIHKDGQAGDFARLD